MSRILVTGATGQLGKEVIQQLISRGSSNSIAALARDPEKVSDLKEKGVEIRIADYDSYESLVAAFQGVDKLYFVSGNDINNRLEQHKNVVKAAKEAKVGHIFYTSFTRKNETSDSPIAFLSESHIKTEQLIKESGISYTILKHTVYMEILPMFLGDKIAESGTIYLPAGSGRVSFLTRNDMALLAAALLDKDTTQSSEYEVAGSSTTSFTEIAEQLSTVFGKKIGYVSPSNQEYASTLTNAGVPAEYVGLMAGFAEGFKQGEFDVTSNLISEITGKTPTSVQEFLDNTYANR